MFDTAVLDSAFAGAETGEHVGSLRVRSGRVTAYDPLYTAPRPPFRVPIPTGDHPVIVVEGGAGALLTFAPGRPVTWEQALTDRQQFAELGPNEFYGYHVGCGLGCFADPEAAALFSRELAVFDDPFDVLEDYLYDDERHGVSHVIGRLPVETAVPVPNPDEYNVVVVRAGNGDAGLYTTWLGRDADGQPLCLLTDFCLGSDE
ncbi:DUF4241 domain-containing protein [Catellatospora methionotrophica]|uniref:DUF4241 domain-containing protein n=1 Tax=Catellatospora methionotrophica TaxID=121620 RepID=UPI0033D66EED